MTDKQIYKILEKFANDHPMAQHIKVEIAPGHHSYKPRNPESPAYYEHCELLSQLVRGAEQFLYWARRNKLWKK